MDNSPKTAQKYAVSPLTGARIPLGAHPGNTGGKKGRSGRRSQKLSLFLAKLRETPDVHAAIEDAARNPESRNFGMALKLMAEYDNEKPAEKKELKGQLEVVVRLAKEGRRVTAS